MILTKNVDFFYTFLNESNDYLRIIIEKILDSLMLLWNSISNTLN